MHMEGWSGSIILECKSQSCGVTKTDAALSHEKTLDFYCERPHAVGRERWGRLIVSSSPVSDTVRAFCIQLGLILCDPARLPLPVVVRTACHPSADLYLHETLLQEAVRMGEPALMTMQDRWTYDPITRDIRFKPRVLRASEICDLLWLQDELGSDILDLYDLHRPGVLERRAAMLYSKLTKSAYLASSFALPCNTNSVSRALSLCAFQCGRPNESPQGSFRARQPLGSCGSCSVSVPVDLSNRPAAATRFIRQTRHL